MKQSLYLLIIAAISLIGCSKENADSIVFTVSNNDTLSLYNFQIKTLFGNSQTKKITIPAHKTMVVRLYMDNVSGDGCYQMNYSKDSVAINTTCKSFGYYTNGVAIEDEIQLTFSTDTVFINSKKN